VKVQARGPTAIRWGLSPGRFKGYFPLGVRLAGGKVGFLPAGGWLGFVGLGAGAPLPTGFAGAPFAVGGTGLTGWRGGLPFAEADPAGGLRATVTPLGLVTKASNPRITVLRQCRLGCLWHFITNLLLLALLTVGHIFPTSWRAMTLQHHQGWAHTHPNNKCA